MSACLLEASELRDIHDMLLVGLAAFAEIDRIHVRVADGPKAELLRSHDLMPLHPTASDETMRDFVDTLRCVNNHLYQMQGGAP